MFGISERLGKFLLRQHGNVQGTLLGKRKFKGQTNTEKVYQQDLRLKCQENGKSLIVRRITVELHRPTRNETVLHLLTSLGSWVILIKG